jgi:adenylate cyclase
MANLFRENLLCALGRRFNPTGVKSSEAPIRSNQMINPLVCSILVAPTEFLTVPNGVWLAVEDTEESREQALNSGMSRPGIMATGQRHLAAIMFTDMVDYSALAQVDEAASLDLLDRHNRILRPVFQRFQGHEVKTVGDAFLVEFESALDAARCAVEIQRILHEQNVSTDAGKRIRIRIGIHVGDVVRSNGDVLGDAVNIASRIQALADPEGICLTQQVYDQVQNKISNPLVKLPPTSLKNIRVAVGVYKVIQPWDSPRPEIQTTAHPAGRRLAVLPLANISPDPRDEYFADGLTEELITVLSQVQGLSVIARTSVAPYKLAPKSVAQVGVELGVDTILEGSVRKAGNRIRITLQLIDVGSQRHIWSSSYNRELDDVFAIQADIAERTAQGLQLELAKGNANRGKTRPTADLAAYDLYLRGLVASTEEGGMGVEEAARCFEGATKLDPTFAEAFAAWANLYVAASGGTLPMQQVMPKARELAARALELDPNSSDAHSALGNIAFQFDLDWARAEQEFGKATTLNPSNVSAHRFFGLMLVALNRFDEAKDEYRRVTALDPGTSARATLTWAEALSGNFAVAIADAERERDANPSSAASHVYLGLYYVAAGRHEDALREAEFPMTDATELERFDHALLDALVGKTDDPRALIADIEHGKAKLYVSGTDLATLYGALGEKERALDLLERDFREGDRTLWLYYHGTWFDSIRNDPRFLSLLRQYGLPVEPPAGPANPTG